MRLFTLILMLTLTTPSFAGISFGSYGQDEAMTSVSQHGFRSISEARDFGRRYGGDEKVLAFLIAERERFAAEMEQYLKVVKRSKQGRRVGRLGQQIAFFTVAISQARKNGASFYCGSEPVK